MDGWGKETTGLHNILALFTLSSLPLTTQALLVQPEHFGTPTFLSLSLARHSETKGGYRHQMAWCDKQPGPFWGHDSRLFSLPLIELL